MVAIFRGSMSPQNAARKPRSPLLFIFLTVFIDLLGFGIVIPLLPVYSEVYRAEPVSILDIKTGNAKVDAQGYPKHIMIKPIGSTGSK